MRLRELADLIREAEPPTGMGTKVVAVDWPGGAGKSTVADLLAGELGAQIVRTDDFASWDDPVNTSERMRYCAATRSSRVELRAAPGRGRRTSTVLVWINRYRIGTERS